MDMQLVVNHPPCNQNIYKIVALTFNTLHALASEHWTRYILSKGEVLAGGVASSGSRCSFSADRVSQAASEMSGEPANPTRRWCEGEGPALGGAGRADEGHGIPQDAWELRDGDAIGGEGRGGPEWGNSGVTAHRERGLRCRRRSPPHTAPQWSSTASDYCTPLTIRFKDTQSSKGP